MMWIPTVLALWRNPDAFRAFLTLAQGGWVLYLFFLAAHALKSSRFWSQSAASNLVFAFGVALPLLFAGLSRIGLDMGRGCPCVEAIILTGFLVRLQLLPLRGILLQHILFLVITIITYHVRTLPQPCTSEDLAWAALSALANFIVSMSFCCVMGLARNRHTTTRAAPCSERANTNKDAGRLGLLQGRLLRRVERKLLKAFPEEVAEATLATLCAAYVTAAFLGCCINYNVPGTLRPSPTLEMLAIMLGMYWSSTDAQHLKHLAFAQHRAYNTVRTLLHGLVPSHVAKRMEALEAEKERMQGSTDFLSRGGNRWNSGQLPRHSMSRRHSIESQGIPVRRSSTASAHVGHSRRQGRRRSQTRRL